jgi:DNA primase
MSISYHIQKILEERKITDFLNSRGIFPAKQHEDRWTYRCPIHKGDNDPSFVVYLKSDKDYQNYHCFSCHSGISIINLLSDMDNISISQAVRQLAVGLDIKDEDILMSIIKDLEKNKFLTSSNIDELSLKINRACYDYLNEVNFNEEEIEFFDNIFKMTDKAAMDNDLETLTEMYNILLDKGIQKRIEIYQNKQEKLLLKNIK